MNPLRIQTKRYIYNRYKREKEFLKIDFTDFIIIFMKCDFSRAYTKLQVKKVRFTGKH